METNNRRDFLKKAALAGASALVAPSLFAADGEGRGELSPKIKAGDLESKSPALIFGESSPLPEDQGWRFGKQIDCSQK